MKLLIYMFYPEQDALNDVEEFKVEFKYFEEDEFSDPVYIIKVDEEAYGRIRLMGGNWKGCLDDCYSYSEEIFDAVTSKLRKLNDTLEESRKGWW